MKLARITLALALCLAFAGCGLKAQAPIPGAVNQFDSDTYLTLSTAKGAIDQAKAELTANAFSGTVATNVKTAINVAVSTYNTADITYQAYHQAALAGTATATQQTAVTAALANLNTAVTSITTAKVGN